MGIAKAPLPSSSVCSNNSLHKQNYSMSQDYHHQQGNIYSFSNGFERSQQEQQQQQQHIAQQIRRDKLRIQGFEPPPPLVGIEEEEPGGVLPAVYETAGMLSEMFNFPGGGAATATELLESQILQSYRNTRAVPPSPANNWFSHHRQGMVVDNNHVDLTDSKNQQQQTVNHHQISGINADSAAAMQLFLMNPPQQQQQRSPSPSSSSHHPPSSTSSTLHMLLPNPSSSHHALPGGGAFGNFTWVPGNETNSNPNPGEVQGLSLSLSSSLQHLEAAKAEELRMGGDGGMMFFGSTNTPAGYQFKNLGQQQLHVPGVAGSSSSSSFGTVNMLRNSKYAKAAQELLEEFCSVGRGQFKKGKFRRQNNNGNPSSSGAGNSSPSSKEAPPQPPTLSAADRLEHQRRKVKLLSMLDEVDRRYNHYCEQMQMVVNSFDMVMGFGSAVPYTSLAQKAMSRHFRCLKDAISAQLKHSCELLGEKDAGSSGVTKGETPRLRILEQSLRQQRAFHQMGMMEQEAWRPQRGLPERSVNILRAWLFEHFLHPYPSDADKHLLARQTGLSRNQVSNWFINARVRLWKPMVEEMYQQEAKDNDDDQSDPDQDSSATAMLPPSAAAAAAVNTTTPPSSASGKRPEAISNNNAVVHENDPSYIAINRQSSFSENQPNNHLHHHGGGGASAAAARDFPAMHDGQGGGGDIDAALIRFGTSAGDVSLTLGLRHAGNLPAEKSQFSVRDFGGC